MPDIFNFTPEMETYFSTLPVYVQENIKQNIRNERDSYTQGRERD